MALAAPRRGRPGLARPPPAARRDLVADRHELRGLLARGDGRAGSACSTTTAPRPGTSSPSTPSASGTASSPASRSASCYGFRVDGPWDPDARPAVQPGQAAARPLRPGDHRRGRRTARPRSPTTPATRCRAATIDSARRDAAVGGRPRRVRLGGRRPPAAPAGATPSIYELHVKGYTQLHNEIPEHLRGTYAGLGSHTVIRYLQDLGVTAVELLPVHHFVTEPAVADARDDQLLGLQLDRLLRPARGVLLVRRRAASRSRSSSRWSRTSTAPASR